MNDRTGWTTLLAMNPQTKVEFVARRFDRKADAERAAALLSRGGLPARCVPWIPSHYPGYPPKEARK